MGEVRLTRGGATSNGAVGEWHDVVGDQEYVPVVRGKARPVHVKAKPVAKPRGKRGVRYGRKLAYAAGGVQAGLLALSVTHCTEAIGLLTGSHWALAGLLAIGVDVGLVVSEAAEIAGHGSKGSWVHWARAYTVLTVLLSMGLNGYAFSQHSPVTWAAWALGAAIPGLVYALGQVACGLWLKAE